MTSSQHDAEPAATMYDRVIQLITRPPAERPAHQIDLFLPFLRKKSDLLAGLEKGVLMDLVRNCEYQRVDKDTVIIKQGDIGDCFYIMLTGRTSVYIDTDTLDDDQPPPPPPPPPPPSSPPLPPEAETGEEEAPPPVETLETEEMPAEGEPEDDSPITDIGAEMDAKKKRLDRSQFGKFIIVFGAGKAFGELALMTADAVRNASIITDEDADLLVINRDLFNRSLKAKQEADYAERRSYINNHPFFRGWNAKFKRLLEMSIHKESYSFGDTLIRQGSPTVGLHFLLRGQAKIVIEPGMHQQQFPRYFDGSYNSLVRELGKNFQKKEEEFKSRENLRQAHVRVRRRDGYAAAERRLREKALTLCFINENEVLGDAETLLALETYHYSVVCMTNTDVFILDSRNIERLIQKKNPSTLNKLRSGLAEKMQNRIDTNLGNKIALLPLLLARIQEMEPQKHRYTEEENNENNQPNTEGVDDMKKVVNLFMADRGPLITPCVPGALDNMERAAKKSAARHRTVTLPTNRPPNTTAKGAATSNVEKEEAIVSPDARLERARKTYRRKPRSRRELQRISFCHPVAYYAHGYGKSAPQNATDNEAHGPFGFLPSHLSQNFMNSANGDKSNYCNNFPNNVRNDTDLEDVGRTTSGNEPVKRVFLTETPVEPAQTDTSPEFTSVVYDEPPKKDYQVRPMTTMTKSRTSADMMSNAAMTSRPKSAPVSTFTLPPGHDQSSDVMGGQNEYFDFDTGDAALTELENKLRSFHDEFELYKAGEVDVCRIDSPPKITPMKRFVIETPADLPIAGGTVFVRQKQCVHQGQGRVLGRSGAHSHVRRFIIPKNAYAVATESLEEMAQRASQLAAIRRSQAANSASSTRRRRINSATTGHTRKHTPPAISWH